MKKRKLKKKNLVILLVIMSSLVTLIISSVQILGWFLDSKHTKEVEEKITQKTDIVEVDDSPSTEIIEQSEEIPKPNPYWDYIKMKLINVEFAELKKTNSDVVGWIQVNGTNINYPVVQTNDNDYYLTHSIDKSYNKAGWVFMDYRNNVSNFDKNTIIYAHGRVDTTMFGSLKNIMKSNWYSNVNNHVIKMSTEYENTLWQVFSIYHIPTTNDYIQTQFAINEVYLNWLKMLKDRSYYEFDTSLSENDKIITLSTCLNEDEKVVLHAKLIKKEMRLS